ncbi:MAG: exosortase-associated EpsI family protein [Verrucomicrobiota bacterium]|jgi:hypothetical protein
MKGRKAIILALALVLMAGTAGLLGQLRAHQRLGRPGVKTSPLSGSGIKLQVDLPERVLDYKSQAVETDKVALNILPPDTSFGQRRYTAPDGFVTAINVVLMGTDRTSMHKPEICLGGSGFSIDQGASKEERVRIDRPRPYDLLVMKLVTTKEIEANGQRTTLRGIYAYWFVAEDCCTAQHWQRMWWTMEHMMRTGVLQRWAYISCFSICAPGQEEAAFDRMKKFLAAAVPQFQLFPRPEDPAVAARP